MSFGDKYIEMKRQLYFFIAISFFVSGCSSIITSRKQKSPIVKDFYAGNLKKVEKALKDKAQAYSGSIDELAWQLEYATALFVAGDYEKSLKAFEKCEKAIKDYESRALISSREVGLEGAVLLTNLNSLPYKGRNIDKTMLYAYKALNYFALNNKSGALVEIRRMREEQKTIIKRHQEELDKYKKDIQNINRLNQQKVNKLGRRSRNTSVSFEQIKNNPAIKKVYQKNFKFSNQLYKNLSNPFISYLSALGYLLERNYNEALLDFRNLYEMNPNSTLVQKYLVTCAKYIGGQVPDELSEVEPFKYPLDNNIVFVLFFNGRGSALKSQTFQIILPVVGYTGIAFPVYENFKSFVEKMQFEVLINGKAEIISTQKIADFDAVKFQEYQDNFPLIITRIVASSLAKELASFVAVYAAKQAGAGFGLAALALTGFYKYLFNTADTRSWETLPKEVQVCHFPYPDNGVIKFDNKEIKTGLDKSEVFQLQKKSKVSIIYIRALNKKRIIYRIFELE